MGLTWLKVSSFPLLRLVTLLFFFLVLLFFGDSVELLDWEARPGLNSLCSDSLLRGLPSLKNCVMSSSSKAYSLPWLRRFIEVIFFLHERVYIPWPAHTSHATPRLE